MRPAMSLLAAALYYTYNAGFNVWTFLANWLKLVCVSFPFAYFTQLFFIRSAVRTIFKFVFRRDIKARARRSAAEGAERQKLMPESEADAVEAIFRRVDEIKEVLRDEIVERIMEKRQNRT